MAVDHQCLLTEVILLFLCEVVELVVVVVHLWDVEVRQEHSVVEVVRQFQEVHHLLGEALHLALEVEACPPLLVVEEDEEEQAVVLPLLQPVEGLHSFLTMLGTQSALIQATDLVVVAGKACMMETMVTALKQSCVNMTGVVVVGAMLTVLPHHAA